MWTSHDLRDKINGIDEPDFQCRRVTSTGGAVTIVPPPFSVVSHGVLAAAAALANEHCARAHAPLHCSVLPASTVGVAAVLLLSFAPVDPFAGSEFGEELQALNDMYRRRKGFLTPQVWLRCV